MRFDATRSSAPDSIAWSRCASASIARTRRRWRRRAAMPRPAAPPGMPATTAAPRAATPAAQAGGEPITVKTDVFDVELSTLGGDIRRVTMKKVHSAQDRNLPLTLLEPDPQHFFVAQSGLLGEGLPTHLTAYEAERKSYTLPDGRDEIEVRLRSRDAKGAEVVKRYVFHRGSYVIDVSYEVKNTSDRPLAPVAYFQFMRDGNPPSEAAAQTSAFAGVTTFTGPAGYTK